MLTAISMLAENGIHNESPVSNLEYQPLLAFDGLVAGACAFQNDVHE